MALRTSSQNATSSPHALSSPDALSSSRRPPQRKTHLTHKGRLLRSSLPLTQPVEASALPTTLSRNTREMIEARTGERKEGYGKKGHVARWEGWLSNAPMHRCRKLWMGQWAAGVSQAPEVRWPCQPFRPRRPCRRRRKHPGLPQLRDSVPSAPRLPQSQDRFQVTEEQTSLCVLWESEGTKGSMRGGIRTLGLYATQDPMAS